MLQVVESLILKGYYNFLVIHTCCYIVVESLILKGYYNGRCRGWVILEVVESLILKGYYNLQTLRSRTL